MKTKRWILYAFISTISLISIVFILMLWSDTYSNTHPKRKTFYTEPNTRVMRVDYILDNKEKYNSFIFGSSRVGHINPLIIEDGNYYNMTYSEGIPKEHLLNIALFIKSGVKIKNLLIGFDDFSYRVSFDKHQMQGLTKSHYLATNTSLITYYRELYLRFPLGEDRHHLKKKLFKEKGFNLTISNQFNNYTYQEKNFSRDKFTTIEHLRKEAFNNPNIYSGNTLKETIKDIQAIKKLCTINNINCTFFINPIQKKLYEYTDIKLLNKFRYKLSIITDYYDFAYPNKISNDNSYWYETAHYTLEVGDMILSRIYDNNISTKNFGIYVEKRKIK